MTDTPETDDDEAPFEVGYKKPPTHTQWKKGQSGNHRGRPKKAKVFDAIIEKLLDKTHRTPNGQQVSTRELIAARFIKDLSEGKTKQWSSILAYIEKFDGKSDFVATEDDAQRFADLVGQMTQNNKLKQGNNDGWA